MKIKSLVPYICIHLDPANGNAAMGKADLRPSNGGKSMSRETDCRNCLFSQLQSTRKTFTSTLPPFKLKEADSECIQI